MPACRHCYKEYKRTTLLLRHESICGFMRNSSQERERDQEDVPSMQDLYEVVLNLIARNDRLERKVEQLTAAERRKWNAADCLRHDTPERSFDEWCDAIELTSEHLAFTFDNGHEEGVLNAIKTLLVKSAALPFRAFDECANRIYVYERDEWKPLDGNRWTQLIGVVRKRLMKQFVEWQAAHAHRLHEEAFTDLYVENLKKVNGNRKIKNLTQIKQCAYNRLV